MAAADSISFYRSGQDRMSPESRRTGRPWNMLTAQVGERVCYGHALQRDVLTAGRCLVYCSSVSMGLSLRSSQYLWKAGVRRPVLPRQASVEAESAIECR